MVIGGENVQLAHCLTPEDRGLVSLPLYHINAEIVSAMAPLVSGSSVVVPETVFGQRLLAPYFGISVYLVFHRPDDLLLSGQRHGNRRARVPLESDSVRPVGFGPAAPLTAQGVRDKIQLQLLASFAGYASLLERIYEGVEPARALIKLMAEKPAIAHDRSARRVKVGRQAAVRMSGVRFTYPRSRDAVLKDLHLEIAPGTVLGIVGRSGCGKTTIQNLLTRLFDVQEGSVEICGEDVRKWPLDQLRSLFSHVSQNGGVFFSGTRMVDVIRFTRPAASFTDVVRAAKAACIHEDICRLPAKYQSRIGQGGLTLSKGQQQRIALAQALVAMQDDRKILVLDEFTSALDSETEERILQNLGPWLAGRTVIIVAHRLSTVRKLADEIIVLDREGIVEQGTHEELIAAGGWYADMARLQAVSGEADPLAPHRLLVRVG